MNYPLFAIVGLIVLGFGFSSAYAHTTIEVGPYEIEVGWQDEPPVVGILNAITIEIREPGDVEGVSMGITNAFKNLQASVVSGGASKVLDINTDPRPGHYYAKIIPTKTGSLEIKLEGEINGVKINNVIPIEDVESTSVLDFPVTSGSSSGQEVVAIKNAVVSFLGLNYVGEKLRKRAGASKLAGPVAIALMIAIGIGLHNFGEGLAIGAAIVLGEAALGAFLIVGFALHNTTEGFAIAAPMARTKLMIGKLAAMGMIAGVPAIFGAWVGGFVYSPLAAVIFLAIGTGAIFQVIVSIMRWIQNEEGKLSNSSVLAGIAVGMIIMYITSILI